jgi:hypothetical protein
MDFVCGKSIDEESPKSGWKRFEGSRNFAKKFPDR